MSIPDVRKSQAVVVTPSKTLLTKPNLNKTLPQTTSPKVEYKHSQPTSTTISSFSEEIDPLNKIAPVNGRDKQKNITSLDNISSSFAFSYSFESQKGYNPNFNKENQDVCIVQANTNNREWEHFFAVCDGHGEHGHFVSSALRNHFLQTFANSPDFYRKPQ